MLDEKLSSFSNPFYLCPGNFDYIENYNNKVLSLRKRKITKLISGYRKKKNNSTITNQNNKVSTAKIEYELSPDQFCLENYTEIKSISSSIEDLEKSLQAEANKKHAKANKKSFKKTAKKEEEEKSESTYASDPSKYMSIYTQEELDEMEDEEEYDSYDDEEEIDYDQYDEYYDDDNK